jgi:hypothetical protein
MVEVREGSLEARVQAAVDGIVLAMSTMESDDDAAGRVRSALEGVLRLFGYRAVVREVAVVVAWYGTVSRSVALDVPGAQVVAKMRDCFDGVGGMEDAAWDAVRHRDVTLPYMAEVEVGGSEVVLLKPDEADGLSVGAAVVPHSGAWDVCLSRLPWDVDVDRMTVVSVDTVFGAVPLE